MATLVERALGAARLDAGVSEEIEHDPAALRQAMTAVAVAAVRAALDYADLLVVIVVTGTIGARIGVTAGVTTST